MIDRIVKDNELLIGEAQIVLQESEVHSEFEDTLASQVRCKKNDKRYRTASLALQQ